VVKEDGGKVKKEIRNKRERKAVFVKLTHQNHGFSTTDTTPFLFLPFDFIL